MKNLKRIRKEVMRTVFVILIMGHARIEVKEH